MDANSLKVEIASAEYRVRGAESALRTARENLFNAQEHLEFLKLQASRGVTEAPTDTRQQLNG